MRSMLLDKTQQFRLLIISCLLTFGCYVASYMRIPIVPLYARTLGATTQMIGVINSAFFFTAGLLSFPLGILSDRWGRKAVSAIGLVILGLTSFMLCATKTPIEVMTVYFLFGAGLAAYGPTMMSLVADVSSKEYMGRAYGWYTTFLYIGMSVGPAIGSWLAGKASFGVVFIASGVLTIFLLLILLSTIPNVKPPTPKKDDSQKTVKTIEAIKNKALIGCWLVTFGGCFALGMFVTFIPLHAKDAGIAIPHIGLVFFAQGFSNAIARIPFGWFSDKTGDRRYLVTAGILMAIISMVGFSISTSLIHFIIFALFLGTGMAIAFPSIGALIAETVPSSVRGFAMGGYNTSIYFGIMVASIAMGAIIERYGYKLAFVTSTLIILLTLAIFGCMTRKKSSKGL